MITMEIFPFLHGWFAIPSYSSCFSTPADYFHFGELEVFSVRFFRMLPLNLVELDFGSIMPVYTLPKMNCSSIESEESLLQEVAFFKKAHMRID
jgi:hypothetical protein